MMLRFLLLALLAISLSGCGDTIAGKGAAEPEVARFHEMLKRRNFEAMYAATGAEFKSLVPRATALALFAAIDRKLGSLRQTKQINWNVNTRNLITTVALVYQSRFEAGEATETFTFRVQNGKPELIGYNIASMDMLIK
jgi:hypothetical protein